MILQALSGFQFHIGMINPSELNLKYDTTITFQFHIGMINPLWITKY